MRPWVIGCCTLLADQLTKHLVRANFLLGESLPLLPPFLHLTYVQNTGAAFGLFKGQTALFIGLSILVIVWLSWELLRHPRLSSSTLWGYALILGGASGNLIDRLRLGSVVDFIDFRVWPVFNIGDSAITIGVGLLIRHSLFAARRQGRPERPEV